MWIHSQTHRDDDKGSPERPTEFLVTPIRCPEIVRHERNESVAGGKRRLDYFLPGERWLDLLMSDETGKWPALECRGDRTDEPSVGSRMTEEEADAAGGPEVKRIIAISCSLWLCQRRCLRLLDRLCGRLNAIAYTTKPRAHARGVLCVLGVVVEDGLDQRQETPSLIWVIPIDRS
jgi:hypothetical protein